MFLTKRSRQAPATPQNVELAVCGEGWRGPATACEVPRGLATAGAAVLDLVPNSLLIRATNPELVVSISGIAQLCRFARPQRQVPPPGMDRVSSLRA